MPIDMTMLWSVSLSRQAMPEFTFSIANPTTPSELGNEYDRVCGIPMTVMNGERSFYGALDDEEYIDETLKLA
jgi:hypothetical protein